MPGERASSFQEQRHSVPDQIWFIMAASLTERTKSPERKAPPPSPAKSSKTEGQTARFCSNKHHMASFSMALPDTVLYKPLHLHLLILYCSYINPDSDTMALVFGDSTTSPLGHFLVRQPTSNA